MFHLESSARTGFGEVDCPIGDACSLLGCMFKHDTSPAQRAWMNMPLDQASSKPFQSSTAHPVQSSAAHPVSRGPGKPQSQPFLGFLAKTITTPKVSKAHNGLGAAPAAKSQTHSDGTSDPVADSPGPGTISPPPLKKNRVEELVHNPPVQTAQLYPRELSHNPAPFPKRLSYIQHFHREFKRLNQLACESNDANAIVVRLLSDQVIELANDAEAVIARGQVNIYENKIRHRLVELKKMKLAEWVAERVDVRAQEKTPAPSLASRVNPSRPLNTGLTSDQEIYVVRRMTAEQNGLDAFGYVTRPPSKQDIEDARGYWQSHHYESCERCGGRFQIFHHRRDEDGALTSNGPCRHHWGRITRGTYTCCSGSIGSTLGCTTWPTHVFKSKSAPEMSVPLEFACTPDNSDADPNQPVCFDCEMAFTTNGMELIRLTAIAWPGKNSLIDVLVRPAGHILDLNTRFSGVTVEMLESAKPCSGLIRSPEPCQDQDIMDADATQALSIVESPASARKLLFSILTPRTPLMGHAIENDLNAVRIIHPCIIDTVILFPHDAGPLPNRMSLKALTKKFLWRDIQMGGAEGHDSREDAVATADLVLLAVSREWRRMKNKQGWRIEEGRFVAPNDTEHVDFLDDASIAVDPASSVKRKRGRDDRMLDYGSGS